MIKKLFSGPNPFLPSVVSIITVSVFGLISWIAFNVKYDYQAALFLYAIIIVSGAVLGAVFYVIALKNKLDKSTFSLGTFKKREDFHKAVQEISGRCAEVAAAFGIVLFALGVIRPYSESLRYASSEVIRNNYLPLRQEIGSTYINICFRQSGPVQAMSIASKTSCDFLSTFDIREAEKNALGPTFRHRAEDISTTTVEDRQVRSFFLSLSDKADAIEKNSPDIQYSRESLRTLPQLSGVSSRFGWLSLFGGFALALASALKLGRAFADKAAIRSGSSADSINNNSEASAVSCQQPGKLPASELNVARPIVNISQEAALHEAPMLPTRPKHIELNRNS